MWYSNSKNAAHRSVTRTSKSNKRWQGQSWHSQCDACRVIDIPEGYSSYNSTAPPSRLLYRELNWTRVDALEASSVADVMRFDNFRAVVCHSHHHYRNLRWIWWWCSTHFRRSRRLYCENSCDFTNWTLLWLDSNGMGRVRSSMEQHWLLQEILKVLIQHKWS